MSVRRAVTAGALALGCVLSGCGSDTPSSPSSDHSGPVANPPHTIASGSATVVPSPSESSIGSPDHPVVAALGQAPLQWKSVAGPTANLVTVGDGWTLTVPQGGATARLAGPHPRTIRAGDHASVSDAFLDDHHALVVSEDRQATDPDRATLVDLASGKAQVLDGRSDPPTVAGGTWALGPESLVHATLDGHRRYCLATVALSDLSGSTGWCAQPRQGFSRAAITDDGTSMMTFDDHHPSCRTLHQVDGTQLTAFPGVVACKGWDSALLDGTTVWSVVPNPHRIDVAHFYAHTETGWWDLGPGTSGSLVTCAGAAYFTRDPDTRTDPAMLLRWQPDTASLTTAYRSGATGNAFLSPARCGGSHLTVTAYSDAGDEQVTTDLG